MYSFGQVIISNDDDKEQIFLIAGNINKCYNMYTYFCFSKMVFSGSFFFCSTFLLAIGTLLGSSVKTRLHLQKTVLITSISISQNCFFFNFLSP